VRPSAGRATGTVTARSSGTQTCDQSPIRSLAVRPGRSPAARPPKVDRSGRAAPRAGQEQIRMAAPDRPTRRKILRRMRSPACRSSSAAHRHGVNGASIHRHVRLATPTAPPVDDARRRRSSSIPDGRS
jgi:hypothetical protein